MGGGPQPAHHPPQALVAQVMEACRTLTEAVWLLCITWDQAQRTMEPSVRRGLACRQEAVIPHIGIEEENFAKGHDTGADPAGAVAALAEVARLRAEFGHMTRQRDILKRLRPLWTRNREAV